MAFICIFKYRKYFLILLFPFSDSKRNFKAFTYLNFYKMSRIDMKKTMNDQT